MENTGKLAEALAKAQGAIKPAKKDKANPFFKSKYSDLASVWEACREALSTNGIAVVQAPCINDGVFGIETKIIHSSGEFETSFMPVAAPITAKAQEMGSAITYARRYSLAAMVGVAPEEDDDGNEAQKTKPEPVKKTYTKETPIQRHSDEMTAKCKAYAEAIDIAPDLDTLEKHVKDNAVFMNEVFDKEPAYHARLTAKLNAKRESFSNASV